jgi:polysaccharide pyruvyl transferase WcaK-like protein
MIYVTGANERISGDVDLSYNFMEVGYNTGNMAIARGVRDILFREFGVLAPPYNSSADITSEDILVIGAANWISKSVNLDWLFQPGIERFTKILVLGIGVQNEVKNLNELSSSCTRLISWLIEKNATVCTRDKFSHEFLSAYLKNVFWTGCPSLRIDSTRVQRPANISGISYGGSIEVLSHAKNTQQLIDFERQIFHNAPSLGNFNSYIMQAELPLMESIRKKNWIEFQAYVSKKISIDSVDQKFLNKFSYFFSIDDWMESLAASKIFIGTRLHGNILAWHCGVSPFLITHDSRTQAFIEDFKFPGVQLADGLLFDDCVEMARKANTSNFVEILQLTNVNLQAALRCFQ